MNEIKSMTHLHGSKYILFNKSSIASRSIIDFMEINKYVTIK